MTIDKKTQELFERAKKVDPAQIGHYIDGGFMSPKIKPISEDMKVIGPAFTVRFAGKSSIMLYYAMSKAPKGSVIVIDRMGENRFACVGEIVVRTAMSLGLAGIVVDGPSTDTRPQKELGLPLFSSGRSAVTTNIDSVNGDYNIPVNCGGVVVEPGDIIYGDVDGVIVAKPDMLEKLVEKGEAADAREVIMRESFERGDGHPFLADIVKKVEESDGGYLNKKHISEE